MKNYSANLEINVKWTRNSPLIACFALEASKIRVVEARGRLPPYPRFSQIQHSGGLTNTEATQGLF